MQNLKRRKERRDFKTDRIRGRLKEIQVEIRKEENASGRGRAKKHG
jgi:hypothetical protein